MSYEKRVGQRMDLGDMTVQWTPLGQQGEHAAPRPKRRQKPEPVTVQGYLRNVSASGVGVVAPADDSIAPGSRVEVRFDPDTAFVGRVRRVLPTAESSWRFYGVEIAEQSPAFGQWLADLLDMHRGGIVTESHWRSSF
jgi:hypothetical protein